MSVPSLLMETKDEKNNTTIYKWKTDLMASQKYWTGNLFIFYKQKYKEIIHI